jgi:hypothetical protein
LPDLTIIAPCRDFAFCQAHLAHNDAAKLRAGALQSLCARCHESKALLWSLGCFGASKFHSYDITLPISGLSLRMNASSHSHSTPCSGLRLMSVMSMGWYPTFSIKLTTRAIVVS